MNRRVMRALSWALASCITASLLYFLAGRVDARSSALAVHTLDIEAAPSDRSARRLRITAWNIAHGRGLAPSNWNGGTRTERTRRLARMAVTLSAIDADVVVLNEVDFDSSWSHGIDQARTLSRAIGLPHVACQRNIDAQLPGLRFRFGNALLSRYPLSDARVLWLPALHPWEPWFAGHKKALVATAHPPGAAPLRVAAVHLEHRSERVRVASARRLLALARTPGPPLILAGDFNSTPDGYPEQGADEDGHSALQLLLGSGRFHACNEIEPDEPWLSFPSDAPRRLIDWILLPTGLRFVGCQTLAVSGSDHRPVLAELALPRR